MSDGRGRTRASELSRASVRSCTHGRTGATLAALAVCAALVLASCATAPFSFRSDPLSLLGEGADAWLVVPVQANRGLIEAVAAKNPGLGATDRALDRTETLYAGIYGGAKASNADMTVNGAAKANATDMAGTSDMTGTDGGAKTENADMTVESGVNGSAPASLRLIATGSFPKSARSVVFPKSRGWVKSKDDAWGTWYALDGVGASIPESGLYCMADAASLPAMLERVARGTEGRAAAPPAMEAYLLAPPGDGRIALFIGDPKRLVEAILPPDADFGIEDILIFARPNAQTGVYSVSAKISLERERSSRALAALLRLTLNCRASAAEGGVIVSDCELSTERLADLAGFFYF